MIKPNVRRIVLGVGAALLVGGWALTGYANAQPQAANDVDNDMAELMWQRDAKDRFRDSRTFHMLVVVSMALGAGLIGFGVLRVEK